MTAILTEAGKDSYPALKQWLKNLLTKLFELKNPITELVSYQRECQISFLLRGRTIKQNHSALEKLSQAAQIAAVLVHKMTAAGFVPVKLVYEFDGEKEHWFPSSAELKDGRLITDNAKLKKVEELPTGLSLGLTLPDVNRHSATQQV